MPAAPPTTHEIAARPSPLRCIRRLEKLAVLHIELGLLLERRDAPKGGGGGHSKAPGSPAPLNVTVADGRREIEVFAEEYLGMLARDTAHRHRADIANRAPKPVKPWRRPAGATVPALVLELASHIGHFTSHASARVAWAFDEDLERALSRAEQAANPVDVARIPIGKTCEVEGCGGVYEIRVPESTADADDAARERAFRQAWPTASCSKDRAHQSGPQDLRHPVDEVTTAQLAHWFGLEISSVRKRLRGAGISPIGERGRAHESLWDRNVALMVMTRRRDGR